MGLPMWRNPDEKAEANKKKGTARDALHTDPTAATRSSIRRRARILSPPLVGRQRHSARRDDGGRSLPSVATLLETAHRTSISDSAASRPPHPAPEAMNSSAGTREAFERRQMQEMQEATVAGRERVQARHGQNMRYASRLLPRHYNRWSAEERRLWSETNMHSSSGEGSAHESGVVVAPEVPPFMGRAELEEGLGAIGILNRFGGTHRSNPPTPPREATPSSSALDSHVLSARLIPPTDGGNDPSSRSNRSNHPLSRSWRPTSTLSSSRSASPGSDDMTDAWEVIQTAITPDETLPSAGSSFTSTVVTTRSPTDSATPETTPASSFAGNDPDTQNFTRTGSVSSFDGPMPALVCDEEDESTNDMMLVTEALAEEMYAMESRSAAGRARISTHQAEREAEGTNRYAWDDESDTVEIGFRLLDHALGSVEGTGRVADVQTALLRRTGTVATLRSRMEARRNRPAATARLPFVRRPQGAQLQHPTPVFRVPGNHGGPGGPLNSHPVSDGNDYGVAVAEARDNRPAGQPGLLTVPSPLQMEPRSATLQSSAPNARQIIAPAASDRATYEAARRDHERWMAVISALRPATGDGITRHSLDLRRMLALVEAGEPVPEDIWATYGPPNATVSNATEGVAADLSRRDILRRMRAIGPPSAPTPEAERRMRVDMRHTARSRTAELERLADAGQRLVRQGTEGLDALFSDASTPRREDGTQPAMRILD